MIHGATIARPRRPATQVSFITQLHNNNASHSVSLPFASTFTFFNLFLCSPILGIGGSGRLYKGEREMDVCIAGRRVLGGVWLEPD